MDKLKPCPFCGGEANIERVDDKCPNYVIKCGCCRVNTRWYADKKALAVAWNTRYEPPKECD